MSSSSCKNATVLQDGKNAKCAPALTRNFSGIRDLAQNYFPSKLQFFFTPLYNFLKIIENCARKFRKIYSKFFNVISKFL